MRLREEVRVRDFPYGAGENRCVRDVVVPAEAFVLNASIPDGMETNQ